MIKDDLLDPIDKLLEDEHLVELVRQALAERSPLSAKTGRRGIAPDRLIRCCALKHVKGWSLRELEREIRASLVYRRFTHFDDDVVPDYSTFSRAFSVLSEDVTRQINTEVVLKAAQENIIRGQRMRSDTTVVETNIHHPTDSTLLADGVRVLTRTLKRLAGECAPGAIEVVDRARAVKHRVIEIHRAAKAVATEGKERIRKSYGKLIGIVRGVVGQAEQVLGDLDAGRLPLAGSLPKAMAFEATLKHYMPLVKRVIHQTTERIFNGDNHVEGKLLSLFEPHTQVIRKGKAHKPTEFGRLIRIDEVENGIVSGYEVAPGNKADSTNWMPAVEQHKELFGQAPKMATGDRGFFSAENEKASQALGVEQVALPARGRLSEKRRALQKERWFRRAQGWRAGVEARIATLKHRFGMARAFYKGERGFERWVGWSVIANNLVSMARVQTRRERKRRAA